MESSTIYRRLTSGLTTVPMERIMAEGCQIINGEPPNAKTNKKRGVYYY